MRNKILIVLCFIVPLALAALWTGIGQVRRADSGATQPPTGTLGKALFTEKCAECHGSDGKGDGPAAAVLNPRPRDFTAGKFKFRTTESGSIPTDDDLRHTIVNGLHGTAMPDLQPFLRGDSLQAVIDYVKSFSPRFARETPAQVKAPGAFAPTPAAVAAGEKVYRKLECASCHGSDGTGTGAVATDLRDDWGHTVMAANLTEPWTFRGGSAPEDIYLRFRTGLDGSPMPSYRGTASEQELRDLASYVASLGRKPVWEMGAEELRAFYSREDAKAKADPVTRGKYLVTTIGCAMCHSPVREDGSMIEELRFAGGQRWDLFPFDNVVSYNLTSDKETGLGGWTDDQLKTFLTRGIRRDGSRMLPYPMPWPALAGLKQEDLNAIIAYLRTIPPVYNKIPTPASPGLFSYFWGKFELLILKKDLPVRAYAGNAGSTKPAAMSANAAPGGAQNGEDRP